MRTYFLGFKCLLKGIDMSENDWVPQVLEDIGWDTYRVRYRFGQRIKVRGHLKIVQMVESGPPSPILEEVVAAPRWLVDQGLVLGTGEGSGVLVMDPRAVVRRESGKVVYDGSMVILRGELERDS